MNGLDFRKATDLFLSSELELALALGITPVELRRYRRVPGTAPAGLMERLGGVLLERGRGMARVGELLAGN